MSPLFKEENSVPHANRAILPGSSTEFLTLEGRVGYFKRCQREGPSLPHPELSRSLPGYFIWLPSFYLTRAISVTAFAKYGFSMEITNYLNLHDLLLSVGQLK